MWLQRLPNDLDLDVINIGMYEAYLDDPQPSKVTVLMGGIAKKN